jgi:hypothetical protein
MVQLAGMFVVVTGLIIANTQQRSRQVAVHALPIARHERR